jgi:hypothetical protein
MKRIILAIAIVLAIALVVGSVWAGEWHYYPDTVTNELPLFGIYVEDDEEVIHGVDGVIGVRKKEPCPYQIRTIPAEEANRFLRENLGWEPFEVLLNRDDSSSRQFVHSDEWDLKTYIYLRRRVCE